MIRVTAKPITTSKNKRVIKDALQKSRRANKNILLAVQEEQKRQNRGISYCSLRIVK